MTGVDLAASQIDLVHTRFPQHRWLRADMRAVVLDEEFDAVVAWNSLTWLSHADEALMVSRFEAWLKPGGRLLFNAAAEEDMTGDYRDGSPYRAELEAANYSAQLVRRGLIEVAHVTADQACDGAGVWLARKPEA